MLGKNCTSSRFSKELTVINNLRDCEPKLISKKASILRGQKPLTSAPNPLSFSVPQSARLYFTARYRNKFCIPAGTRDKVARTAPFTLETAGKTRRTGRFIRRYKCCVCNRTTSAYYSTRKNVLSKDPRFAKEPRSRRSVHNNASKNASDGNGNLYFTVLSRRIFFNRSPSQRRESCRLMATAHLNLFSPLSAPSS